MKAYIESDRLTSAERIKAVVTGTRVDRVPVLSMASAYAAVGAGVPVKDFLLDPKLAFDLLKRTQESQHYDGGLSYSIPDGGGWDFGGDLQFHPSPPHALPFIARRAVSSPADVEALEVPDPRTAPAAGRSMAFAKIASENGFGVSIHGGSPFGLAVSIAGPDLLLRWLIKEPNVVRALLRKATDYLLTIADIYVNEFGSEKITAFCTYPCEAHALVSPRVFEEFSLPFIVELHEKLMSKGVKKWLIHLCGNHTKNLLHWKEEIPLLPRTTFAIGHEMDIRKTGEFFGDDHVIAGNVPTTLLHTGIYCDVFEASKQIILKMKDRPGGFMLAPACALPPKTPPQNVQAMIDAARQFGRYD
ncbi:MAG: hypothetical protein M1548_02250 [Actinobacteria bacterium]|nr:hypothetical protein [Actinomycetota bacterium]